MMDNTGPEKKTAEKNAPLKTAGHGRRIEEVHFLDYIRHKKTHKHIEEVAVEDYLNWKKSSSD